MKIEIDKNELQHLIYALNLAEWMTEDPIEEKTKENKMFISLLNKLGKIAESDNLFNWIVKSGDGERYVLNDDKMDWMYYNIIEPYNDKRHLEYLASNLAWIDMYKKYGEEEINDMDREERFIEVTELIESYLDKFEEYGLGGLRYDTK